MSSWGGQWTPELIGDPSNHPSPAVDPHSGAGFGQNYLVHPNGFDMMPSREAAFSVFEMTASSAPAEFNFQHKETDTGGMKFPRQVDITAHHPETGEESGHARYYPPKRKGGPLSIDKVEGHIPGAASALLNEIESRHPGSATKFLYEVKRNNNNPDVTGHAHEHAGKPSDWDAHYPNLAPTLHRGLALPLSSRSARIVNSSSPKEEHLTELHDALAGSSLGPHWTEDERAAQLFAHNAVSDHRSQIPVVLHAKTPARKDIETREQHLYRGGIFPYGDPHSKENEVPFRKGRTVEVTGMSWRPDHPHPDADEHGWIHHSYADHEHRHHTATVRAIPSGKPPVDWDTVGRIYPHLYGDPGVHGEAAEGADGQGIGGAVNQLAHDRPDDPGAESSSEHELEFHPFKSVPTEHIDYVRHPPSDSRVRHAIEGYQSNPDKVPPLVLVHRHGVYHVADGHHRAAAAAYARVEPRALVVYSPHPDEPFSDGTKGPFHGAEPTSHHVAMPKRQYGEVSDVAGSHVFRGVHGYDSHAAAESTRQGVPGGGDLGPGIYVAEKPWLAIQHAGGGSPDESGVVLHGQIHPDAKVGHVDWAPHHVSGGQALNDWARSEGHDVLTRGWAGGRIHVVLNPSVMKWNPKNYSVDEARHLLDDTHWQKGEGGDYTPPSEKEYPNLHQAFSTFEVSAALQVEADGEEQDYRISHQAPDSDYGAPLHDVEKMMPGFYTHPHYYDHGQEHLHESMPVIHGARGNPEKKVRIYRALEAEHAGKGFNTGDWVTTSKSYARDHGRMSDPKDDWPVISTVVPAKHLHTEGDVHEWAYNGPKKEWATVSHKGGYNQEVRQREDGTISPVMRRKKSGDSLKGFSIQHHESDVRTEDHKHHVFAYDPEGNYAGQAHARHGEAPYETHLAPEHESGPLRDRMHQLISDRNNLHTSSVDWCAHRHFESCYWPGDNPVPGQIPQRRGACNWKTAFEQMACPMSDPGPMAGMFVKGAQDSTMPPWPDSSMERQASIWVEAIDHEGAAQAPEVRFQFTATWADVRNKAKRIRREGGVRILMASSEGVVGEVRGDHNVYETQLTYVLGSARVGFWNCGCKWSAYAWGRSPKYKRFEGRMCSHALAMQFEAQARSAHGREVMPDVNRPNWLKQRTPVVIQHQRDKAIDLTRREVPPGNMRQVFSMWEMPDGGAAVSRVGSMVAGPLQYISTGPDPDLHMTVQRALDRVHEDERDRHADDATYSENYHPLKNSDIPEEHHAGWRFQRNVDGAPPISNMFAELFGPQKEDQHLPPVSVTQYRHPVNREPLHLDEHGNSYRRHYEWTRPDATVPEFKGWTGPHSAAETLRDHPTWSQSFDDQGNRRHHMRTHEERLGLTKTAPTDAHEDIVLRRNKSLAEQGWGVVSHLVTASAVCPECHGPVAPTATACPHCGAQLAPTDAPDVHLGAKQDSEGPSVSGVVLKAADTGRILMLQRGLEDEKDPARGTWEFPGGHHEDGDTTSLHAGIREWEEEIGQPFPEGGVVHHTWTSPNGIYQGHVVVIPSERDLSMKDGRVIPNPDDPKGDFHEQAAWWQVDHAKKNPALRPEVKSGTPWKEIDRAGQDKKAARLAGTQGLELTFEPGFVEDSWWPLTAGSNSGSPLLDTGLITGIPIDPPAHSNSTNPASSGFATSEDPDDWAEPRSTREDLRIGASWQPHEGFDAWRARLSKDLLENGTPHPSHDRLYRSVSDDEMHAAHQHGAFHSLDGKGLFVSDDPDRMAGGAYGGKAGGHIVEIDPAKVNVDSRPSYYNRRLVEKAVDHIPMDAVTRTWTWNGDAKDHLPSDAHRTATLHDEPEPALPSTDGDREAPLPPGTPMPTSDAETMRHGYDDLSEFAEDHPELGNSTVNAHTSSAGPGMQGNFGSPAQQIIDQFQRTAGAHALAAGGQKEDTLDIATAARMHLEKRTAGAGTQKTALKDFSFQEQQQLINEGGPGVTARNLPDLQIEGTHYQSLEAALREKEASGEDVSDIFVL
jgi:8-oxo-dGTP pyrophosphatase MutT (NUDIX family)